MDHNIVVENSNHELEEQNELRARLDAYRQIKHSIDDAEESTTTVSTSATSQDSEVSSSEEGDSDLSSSEHTDSEDRGSSVMEDGDDRDTTTNDYVQNFGQKLSAFDPVKDQNHGQNVVKKPLNPFVIEQQRSKNGYRAPRDVQSVQKPVKLSPKDRIRAKLKSLSPRKSPKQPEVYYEAMGSQAMMSYNEDDDVIGILKKRNDLGIDAMTSEEDNLESLEEENFEETDMMSSLKSKIQRRKHRFRHVSDHSNTIETVDTDQAVMGDHESDHSGKEDSAAL